MSPKTTSLLNSEARLCSILTQISPGTLQTRTGHSCFRSGPLVTWLTTIYCSSMGNTWPVRAAVRMMAVACS